MNSNEERFSTLLRRFTQNEATEPEMREMLNELYTDMADEALETEMKVLFTDAKNNPYEMPVDWKKVWENITKKIQQPPVRKMLWTKVAAASVIILLLSVGGYLYFKSDSPQKQIATTQPQLKDILPGGNKAILTLEDGSQIILDSASNGMVSQQGNTKIIKLKDGQLAYEGSGKELLYNTMTTPKGGHYNITLSDGSKVWLNAASSISFPAAFPGKERRVKVTGEAYFEVAHNASMPFIVEKNDMAVQVLGTHFNVNTYDDEPVIKITLLEGKVKVTKGEKTSLLTPGKQAIVDENIKVVNADTELAVAWKNGATSFKSADIRTIMRQVARWYDVEVAYEGNVPDRTFSGGISRTANLSELLRLLQVSQIHFRVEGNKIIVMP